MLTALIAAGFAISNVVESFYPGLGGIIGPGVGAVEVRGFWLIVLELVISLLVCGHCPGRSCSVGGSRWSASRPSSSTRWFNTPVQPRIGDAVCSVIAAAVLVWNHRSWPWRDRAALRPLGLLAATTVVFTAVTSVAIWAVRAQSRPVPDLLQVVRAALARLTFTVGPVIPQGDGARSVVIATGIIWALTLIGWLVWALYVQATVGARSYSVLKWPA